MRSPIPKYLTIRAVLRARLEREYSPGAKLPPEAQLCRDFGVSRVTIRQSLSMLEKEGLIRREQGRGTFYLGLAAPRTETKPSELSESLIRREGFTKVIRKGIILAPPRVAERLNLAAGTQIVALDRLGFLGDMPIVFIQGYLPLSVGVHVLDADNALRHTTVASFLRDNHGIAIDSVVQTIAATLADPAFAHDLGVEIGTPVLEGDRTYLDASERPVFFTIAFYRADRHRFAIRLKEWREDAFAPRDRSGPPADQEHRP